MSNTLQEIIPVIFFFCFLFIISACRPDVEEVSLSADQTEALLSRAVEVKPVGDPVVVIDDTNSAAPIQIKSQKFELVIESTEKMQKRRRGFTIEVKCSGSCRDIVQDPQNPTSCGVKSGCDPTAAGGCSRLVCERGCAANKCVKTSSGRIPSDLINRR